MQKEVLFVMVSIYRTFSEDSNAEKNCENIQIRSSNTVICISESADNDRTVTISTLIVGPLKKLF